MYCRKDSANLPMGRCSAARVVLLVAFLSAGSATADETAQDSRPERVHIRGQVLDPQGAPVRDAEVLVIAVGGRLAAATRSDAEGRFQLEFSRADVKSPPGFNPDWRNGALVAKAPGFGPGWIELRELEADPEPVLQLVEDVPIRGRILDLEGRPVAGAELELWYIYGNDDQNLDGFLKWTRDHPSMIWRYPPDRMRDLSSEVFLFSSDTPLGEEKEDLTVTTDEEGRFELKGIGRERIARFNLSGPNIASTAFTVVTRPEIEPKWKPGQPNRETRIMLESGADLETVYPATFDHFAGPSRPITGIVRDQETGQPLQGIGVSGDMRGTTNHVHDYTDEEGRYELKGLATEGLLRFHVVPPKDMPYLGANREWIKVTAASPPSETDFELARGVIVRGRLVEAETGSPVDGWVEYYAHQGNRFAEALPDELGPYTRTYTNGGEFQITVLPGPGFLGAKANEDRYLGATEEDFGRPFTWEINEGYRTVNRGLVEPEEFHAVKPLDPEPGTGPITVELEFRSGDSITSMLLDPSGRPVTGVEAKWLSPLARHFEKLAGAEFTVTGIRPGEARRVTFRHEDRQLGAIVEFTAGQVDPASVTLQPFGTLVGRVVDEEGHPVPGAFLGITSEGGVQYIVEREQRRRKGEGLPDRPKPFKLAEDDETGRTDADGRFRITGIITGVRGELIGGPPDAQERDILPTLLAPFNLRSGETLDLGDLTLPTDATSAGQEEDR